jgi:hypothetical protein
MDKLDSVVSSYPGIAMLVVLSANVVLVWLYRSLKWFVKREFESMERHQKSQDTAIAGIQSRLNEYDISFAVSRKSFDALVATIDRHVEKEDQLPLKVQEIADDVGWIKRYIINGKAK